MGARGGGGSRGGGGGAITTAQVQAAHQQYKAAKAGYDAAAKALNDAVANMYPGYKGPKIDYQKVQNKFHKASDKLDKAHAKWSKLKQAKHFQDIGVKPGK